jgi:carboxyl-terminal processing protease
VRSRLEGNTAILRISTFNDQTYPNLRDGLEEMIEEVGGLENLNGVVIDLRNNAGGLLSEAIRVTDAFLEQGRDRVDPRPRAAGWRPLQRDARRHDRRFADGRAGQWRLCLGLRDRGRRDAGSPPRRNRGHQHLRQGSVQSVMPLPGNGAMR